MRESKSSTALIAVLSRIVTFSMTLPAYFVPEEIPPDTKEQCLQYPWFRKLMNDEKLRPIQTPGRQPDQDGNCTFMSRTLNTGETISACQSFFSPPSPGLDNRDQVNWGKLLTFYCLGTGVDGHDGISHGGFLSTIVDHTMGTVGRACPGGVVTYTKYLHVDFQKPVRIPGPLLGLAWVKKIKGRKLWIDARLEDEEGMSYITAESLYLKPRARL